jgi:sporulation protein YlmC with PRC-barrel domain
MTIGTYVQSASTLAGDKVRNPEGEDLGRLEDFVLDLGTGRIVYAVLSFGGVMGIGNKLFAIPPSALTLSQDEDCLVLDVDRRQLEQAPGFDKENWPDFADSRLGSEIAS